jgi:molybdate transport system substrate-binding protein
MRAVSAAAPFVAALCVSGLAAATANADEMKVIASNGVKASVEELAPHFNAGTGNRLHLVFGVAAPLKRQIESGEAFDLAILTNTGIADLAKQGKIDAASITPIARSGIGLGVRAGAHKPDISTADALKRTLLAAKSISWAKEGASGVAFASVVDKMGIGEQVKAKARLASNGAGVGELLVNGDAELGAILVNEIMAIKGVEVVGPLPAELQSYTAFHAGVSSTSKNAAAAKAFAKFLTAPDSAKVFKAKGQEPG